MMLTILGLSKMTEMKTLVYFDIEATSLKSSVRPRVSEVLYLAIKTQKMLNFNHKLLEKFNDMKRYEHLLEFLLRLLATIMPEVSRLPGLDIYNHIGQTRFDKSTGDLIKVFLSCLPFPICYVAQNGISPYYKQN